MPLAYLLKNWRMVMLPAQRCLLEVALEEKDLARFIMQRGKDSQQLLSFGVVRTRTTAYVLCTRSLTRTQLSIKGA